MGNVKLIVCDLDGTLLHSDKTISEYTIKVLRECRRRGIMTAVATARSERGAVGVIFPFSPDFIISSGGARIRYGENIIYSSQISPKIVRDVISMCRNFMNGKGEVTVETDSGHYWDYKVKPLSDTVESNCIYTDFKDFDEPAYKVTAELDNEDYCREIEKKYPQLTFSGYSGELWKRFAMRDADKPNGVRRVCKHMNIDISDAIAFGDDFNDIEMLKLCGIGVAMKNAAIEVKEVANYIAESNDCDGVARFIDKYILENINI